MKRTFLNFHRSPGDGWDPETTFESPEKAIEALTGQGYVARTKEQETEFLKNATAKSVQDAIKDRDKTFLNNWDEKVSKIAGVTRDPAMKTEDFIFGTLKGAFEQKKTIEEQFNELKEKGMTDVQANAELKKQFDAFKLAAKSREEELTGKIGKFEQNFFQSRIDNQINEAMAKIRPTLIKGGTDTEKLMLDNSIENLVNKFKLSYKAVDHNGGIIYHNAADDTPVISTTDGNHLSTFTILQEVFASLVDKERSQGGAGGAGAAGAGSPDGKKVQLPATVKTQVQLYDWLQKEHKVDGKELVPGSKVFNELYEDLKKGLAWR